MGAPPSAWVAQVAHVRDGICGGFLAIACFLLLFLCFFFPRGVDGLPSTQPPPGGRSSDY